MVTNIALGILPTTGTWVIEVTATTIAGSGVSNHVIRAIPLGRYHTEFRDAVTIIRDSDIPVTLTKSYPQDFL